MPKYERISFEDFTGGLSQVKDFLSLEDNELAAALNIEIWNDGKWASRGGCDRYNDLTTNYPIVSAYSFQFAKDSQFTVILCAGNKIYAGFVGDTPTLMNNVGAGGMPIGALNWSWKSINDKAFGSANLGRAGGGSLISWDGTTASVVAGGVLPAVRFLEAWNNRLFAVGSPPLYPNRVYYSTLGNGTDWSTTGIAGSGYLEIGYNDGDAITGLWADKERLLIFKLNRIYQIITANPNTDPTGWRIELLTANGGCVSHSSIKSFDDDIIFVSLYGIQSLQRIQLLGDFEQASLSKNLGINKQLRIDLTTPAYVSGSGSFGGGVMAEFFPEKKMYILAIGTDLYVMQKNPKGNYVFSKYKFYRSNGEAFRAVPVGLLKYSGKNYVLFGTTNTDTVGNYPSIVYPQRFVLDEQFSNFADDNFYKDDNDTTEGAPITYPIDFKTKAFKLNTGYVRSKINKIAVSISKLGFYMEPKYEIQVNTIDKDGIWPIFTETQTIPPLSSNSTGWTIETMVKTIWRKIVGAKKDATFIQFRVTSSTVTVDSPGYVSPIKINGFAAEIAPMNQRRLEK